MSQAVDVRGRETAGRRVARHRFRWTSVAIGVTLALCTIIFVAPFVWLIVTALKTMPELSAYPIHWIPQRPQWANFARALTMIDYGKYAWNSFFLATIFTVLTTLTSALVGFGFARLQGRGKGLLFIVMLCLGYFYVRALAGNRGREARG